MSHAKGFAASKDNVEPVRRQKKGRRIRSFG